MMNKHITTCGVCGIDVCTHVNDTDPVCVDCYKWAKDLEEQHKEPIFVSELSKAWDAIEDTQQIIEDSLAVFQQNGIAIDESLHNILKVFGVAQSKIEDINTKGIKCLNYE
jgi:hypothetical protein